MRSISVKSFLGPFNAPFSKGLWRGLITGEREVNLQGGAINQGRDVEAGQEKTLTWVSLSFDSSGCK